MNTEPVGPFLPDADGCICPQDFVYPGCPVHDRKTRATESELRNRDPEQSDSYSRPCPCCEGVGCEECDHTGRRVVTFVEFDGGVARVNGSAILSPESQAALAAVAKAAYDQMGPPDAS